MAGTRILITGGAGFIGSHLAMQLHRDGHSVVVLDNLLPQVHGDNPQLKQFAQKTLPVLQHHLQMAQNLPEMRAEQNQPSQQGQESGTAWRQDREQLDYQPPRGQDQPQ